MTSVCISQPCSLPTVCQVELDFGDSILKRVACERHAQTILEVTYGPSAPWLSARFTPFELVELVRALDVVDQVVTAEAYTS